MKGLELSRRYFQEAALPMLQEQFPQLLPRLAAGLVGEGSDCLGFDDQASQDHDWGPGFCLWLLREDCAAWAAPLQTAYDALPPVWLGAGPRRDQPQAGRRVGVLCLEDFYAKYLGTPGAPQNLSQWRRIPEHFLCCAVSGEVFWDGPGVFSAVRQELLAFYPPDLRRKKLASRMAVMAQAGQYNFPRCLGRGEVVGARLALDEFVRAGISLIHLLNRRYTPFYKWMHRSLCTLPLLGDTGPLFARLCTGLDQVCQATVEELCRRCLEELCRQGLAPPGDSFLLPHCEELLAQIEDPALQGLWEE